MMTFAINAGRRSDRSVVGAMKQTHQVYSKELI